MQNSKRGKSAFRILHSASKNGTPPWCCPRKRSFGDPVAQAGARVFDCRVEGAKFKMRTMKIHDLKSRTKEFAL